MSYYPNTNNPAQPPVIPGSTNYDSNYSTILKANTVITNSITDGVATLQGGFLTGLQLPQNAQDAVPKSYIRGTIPGGLAKSIQYNDNDVFTGSNNLIYNGTASIGTVILTGIFTDGILDVNAGYINNIVETNGQTSITSKRYVDFAKNRNYFDSLDVSSNSTYSASNIINGTLLRDTLSNVVDSLPTAQNIISYVNNIYESSGTNGIMAINGLYYNFTLINQSSDSVITLASNTGTSIFSTESVFSMRIPPSYVLNATVYLKNVSVPEVIVYINNINWSTVYLRNFFSSTGFNTFLPFKIGNNLLFPGPTSYATTGTTSVTFALADVNLGIIIRDPPAVSQDLFGDLRTSGSFVVQNVSAHLITINPLNCIGSWTFNPTHSVLIDTNKSAYMWLGYENSINYLNVLGISTLT